MAPCDICHQTKSLLWVFDKGVCEDCKLQMLLPGGLGPFLSQNGCNREFGIKPSDLRHLEFHCVENHVRKQFKPMKLFRRTDVEFIVREKLGSVVDARERQNKNRKRRADIKKNLYITASAYHMSTRSGCRPQISARMSDPDHIFATSRQKNALMKQGVQIEYGISLSEASKLIGDSRRKKRSTESLDSSVKPKRSRISSETGLTKPVRISSELAKFMSSPRSVARTEVNKYVHQYIRSHNLKNPQNKREIVPDDALVNLLRLKDSPTINLTCFNIQKHLNPHFLGLGQEDLD